jgi:hypothetical protein
MHVLSFNPQTDAKAKALSDAKLLLQPNALTITGCKVSPTAIALVSIALPLCVVFR